MGDALCPTRRGFVKGMAALGASLCAFGVGGTLSGCATAASNGSKTFIYTGCWNEKGGEKGLWVHTFDEATGKMEGAKQISDEISVGYICIDYDKNLLYVTDECDVAFNKEAGMNAGGGGRIWVFQADPSTGELTEVQRAPSYGSNPSMVSIDPTGKYLVCSIHTAKPCPCKTERNAQGAWEIVPACPDANCVLFERNDDGTVGRVSDILKFRGEAHLSQLHTVTWEPNGLFFVVADKGTGDLYSLSIDQQAGTLKHTSTVSLGKGYSPRYVRFHPDKPWMYCNFESANEVVAFQYDSDGVLTQTGSGAVVPKEWLATVPDGGKYEQQDMKLTDDGAYLYTVFRGSDDNMVGTQRVHGEGGFQGVAALKVDQETGIPENIQSLELDCAWPRGCAIDPEGKHLVVSCLYSDEMISLDINEDGTLADTGNTVEQTTAANVTFFRAKSA